jgi:hypothetical protein
MRQVGTEPENKWRKYREGELDLILSLVPTKENVRRLASSLGRSTGAVEVVYRMAYTKFGRGGKGSDIQKRKIREAKRRCGLIL